MEVKNIILLPKNNLVATLESEPSIRGSEKSYFCARFCPNSLIVLLPIPEKKGCLNLVHHEIHPGESQAPPPHPSAWKARQVIQDQIRDMLEANVIEPSNSLWASPMFLLKPLLKPF